MASDDLIGTLEEEPVYIPEGEYTVRYVTFYTGYYRGMRSAPKIAIKFQIEGDEYDGTSLLAYYNVRAINKPRAERGEFRYGFKSKLYRQYCSLFEDEIEKTTIDWDLFRKYSLIAQVKSVKQDHDRQPIHHLARYSVIDSLTHRADLPF